MSNSGGSRVDRSQPRLVETLRSALRGDRFWYGFLSSKSDDQYGLHLAVLVEPYLQLLISGRKTLESRFSRRQTPPYGIVSVGDVLLLKRSGGPILGICQVAETWFYQVDWAICEEIRRRFSDGLCVQKEEDFWEKVGMASFATLMRVSHVHALRPVSYQKRDRRAWVVLRSRSSQLRLKLR